MKKLWLSLIVMIAVLGVGTVTAQAKTKESNRIVWNKSAKDYEEKINENFKKLPVKTGSPSYVSYTISPKKMAQNKLILYRLSAHKKYLIPVKHITWSSAQNLGWDRKIIIKRPAVYFEISYKTKYGVKNYWVWHGYTGNPAVIATVTKDDWQSTDYFINHPDPFGG